MKPSLMNAVPEIYPQPPELAQGWSLGGFHHIHGTRTGRSPKSVWWAGMANLFWWVDDEKGLGGLIASQILPFGGKCFNFQEVFHQSTINNSFCPRCSSDGHSG